MGCARSKNVSDADIESMQIEFDILKGRLQALFEFKLLMLGAGESGKSTIVKQLRRIHRSKLTQSELDNVSNALHRNAVDCLVALLDAAESFGYALADEEEREAAAVARQHTDGERLSPVQAAQLRKLFAGGAVQKALERRAEFWLLDSCEYYMEHVERFAEAGFEPTEEDVVMARVRTTGLVTTRLEQRVVQSDQDAPSKLHFEVVDVGGQRSERRKWVKCFADVKAVLFVINLAGYNRVLFEAPDQFRIQEALDMLRDISHLDTFADTPLFIFLNKKDLFEKMILQEDMKAAFPDYTGGCKLAPALAFIEEKLREQLPPGRTVHIEVVTSVMKRDIKCAFEEVKKSLHSLNKEKMDAEMTAIVRERKRIQKLLAGGV